MELEARLRDVLGVRVAVRVLPGGDRAAQPRWARRSGWSRWAEGEPPVPGLRVTPGWLTWAGLWGGSGLLH